MHDFRLLWVVLLVEIFTHEISILIKSAEMHVPGI